MSMSMWSCPDSPADKRSGGAGAGDLGRLLGKVIESMGGKSRPGEEEIRGAWKSAAGEAAAGHSTPVSLVKGSLVVSVSSSAWLYELTTRKKEILKALETALGGKKVKDIRFRIG